MTQTATAKSQNQNTEQPTTSQPGKALSPFKAKMQDVDYQLGHMRPQFEAALPSHISPDKFQRTVLTALNLNPDLLDCDRKSLFNAASKAASDGLLPDGRDGALVPFKGQVQWLPMVGGIIKKARQSGEISALGARIVYQNEIDQGKFTHRVIDGVPKVDHEPILWGERGAPVLVYSFVQFKDGNVDFEFLHADDIKKIRGVSRAKSGPWHDWAEEMWKKSAIRRHAKRLPISSELFDTIAADDEMTEFGRQRTEAEDRLRLTAAAQLGGEIEHGTDAEFEVIDGDSAMYEDAPVETNNAAEIDADFLDYLHVQRGELLTAKTKKDRDAINETVADAIAGAYDRGEMTKEEADAARNKWQELSAA